MFQFRFSAALKDFCKPNLKRILNSSNTDNITAGARPLSWRRVSGAGGGCASPFRRALCTQTDGADQAEKNAATEKWVACLMNRTAYKRQWHVQFAKASFNRDGRFGFALTNVMNPIHSFIVAQHNQLTPYVMKMLVLSYKFPFIFSLSTWQWL